MMLKAKIEYELSGPGDCEEHRLSYKDVIGIHKMLVKEGFRKKDITIDFQTESYTCVIADNCVSFEGNVYKEMNMEDEGLPPLERFIDDCVNELGIKLSEDNEPLLTVSVTKSKAPPFDYNVVARLNNFKDNLPTLEKITEKLEWDMIFNCPSTKGDIALYLE